MVSCRDAGNQAKKKIICVMIIIYLTCANNWFIVLDMMANTETATSSKGAKPICLDCGYAPFDFAFHAACHDFLKNHDQEKYEAADAAYRLRMIAIESGSE